MSELLKQSINGNEPLFFAVALFFSAISGQKMRDGQRVALVYSYCLLVAYFDYVDFFTVAAGSSIVIFLMLEVFSSDTKLVSLFSFWYKLQNFIYRLFLEFHGVLFYFALFVSKTPILKERDLSLIAFLVLVITLAAFTSRHRFSTKTISSIIKNLEELAGTPASRSFNTKDRKKLEILIFMEDGSFLDRTEHTHILTPLYFTSRVIRRLKRGGLRSIKNRLDKLKSLRSYIRGYSTIEMQIIRSVGLCFGSYRLTVRRKLFERLFAQSVFNSYIDNLSKKSLARKNFKDWLLSCYLDLVTIQIDTTILSPKKGNSTFQQLFKKDFSELTEEEFFVWCLGLPHYDNGVGERAVNIHIDAIEHFRLDKDAIIETVRKLRGTDSA